MATEEKPTILLVEDSQQLRWTISMHFRARGWRVLRSRSAEQALAVAARRKLDAIVVDSELPRRDNEDPATALKKQGGVPVIVVSGPEPALDELEAKLTRAIGARA